MATSSFAYLVLPFFCAVPIPQIYADTHCHDYSPQEWCSTKAIAELCKVTHHCQQFVNRDLPLSFSGDAVGTSKKLIINGRVVYEKPRQTDATYGRMVFQSPARPDRNNEYFKKLARIRTLFRTQMSKESEEYYNKMLAEHTSTDNSPFDTNVFVPFKELDSYGNFKHAVTIPKVEEKSSSTA
ncbi:uncharacterized protein LOC107040150 isoform X2 [Diachasma alloeum]|uniref:uncharacterized protein LOC107040150 isoform X2 n=1 Tax=Diachasma alloeum TaxID=454923 RepID=UPI00073844B0|nr:uncharacterized protein LOC107040150 isoform X2 [Diachasma alloeum]